MASVADLHLHAAIGLTANLMSLGGLAIAVGMLVDGAVVVIENVVERLSDPKHRRKAPKLQPRFGSRRPKWRCRSHQAC
jgi:Cu/Ag efflux pump CusA